MPLVSIIVTVYNGERYIPLCIQDILRQTFTNFEVILVDDGSTDNTEHICSEFCKQDSRVRFFHEPHKGVAHARQIGIEHAQGEYTIHVDVDDEVNPTMLEEILQTAEMENADLLICDYKEKNQNGEVYHCQQPTALTAKAVINDLLTGKLYGALWNKLIRTSCFRERNVYFRQELNMREDLFFVFDIIPYVNKIAYLPKAFYTYNKTNNNNSLTNTYLTENRNYYDQEVLWCQVALENTLLDDVQKNRFRDSLLNYAYITLSGQIYSKDKWLKVFSRYLQLFNVASPLYKRLIVTMAVKGHYQFSSFIRRMIAATAFKRNRA